MTTLMNTEIGIDEIFKYLLSLQGEQSSKASVLG